MSYPLLGNFTPLLQACDQRVYGSFGLLIFVSGPISASGMASKAVKISHDFHETEKQSLHCMRCYKRKRKTNEPVNKNESVEVSSNKIESC